MIKYLYSTCRLFEKNGVMINSEISYMNNLSMKCDSSDKRDHRDDYVQSQTVHCVFLLLSVRRLRPAPARLVPAATLCYFVLTFRWILNKKQFAKTRKGASLR